MTDDTNQSGASTSLGEFLRQERERRGITIEQVASATKIGIRVLHALEENHYSDLPAKPFIRGFVTSYTRFIGLDSKEVLTRFDSYIDSQIHTKPNREAAYSGYAFEKREGEQSRTFLWIVMGSFIVGGGLVMAILKPSLKHHHQSHADRLRALHGSPTPDEGEVTVIAGAPAATGSTTPFPLMVPSGMPLVASTAIPVAAPSAQPSPITSPVSAPAPVAVAPSPVPVVAAAASPSPSPVPAPSPAPVASPSPVASELATNGKPDPMNSGADLLNKDIHYKGIFKALEAVVVRFKVDGKPVTKFPMKKDKILVLRARDIIRFQVSNPKAMTVRINGSEERLVEDVENVSMHQKTATLIFPRKSAENSGEPFPGEAPLPMTRDPE